MCAGRGVAVAVEMGYCQNWNWYMCIDLVALINPEATQSIAMASQSSICELGSVMKVPCLPTV
jgi:hypothetical protein